MATRTFDTLLAKYPREIQDLARHARTLVQELLPGSEESVDSSGPYVFYGYGPGYKGIVCNLSVSKTGVKLGLVRGIELSDPQRLLEGKGKFHRHIPLKRPSDLGKPGIKQLVRSTLAAWRQRQVTT